MSKDELYMNEAYKAAEKSVARRLKVGACLVDPMGDYYITGYNHMPKGYKPSCDYSIDSLDDAGNPVESLVSYPNVIHAEIDVLLTAARLGIATNKAVLYITDSPCLHCAELIAELGIKKVIYDREYRIKDGITYLKNCGVEVVKYNNN